MPSNTLHVYAKKNRLFLHQSVVDSCNLGKASHSFRQYEHMPRKLRTSLTFSCTRHSLTAFTSTGLKSSAWLLLEVSHTQVFQVLLEAFPEGAGVTSTLSRPPSSAAQELEAHSSRVGGAQTKDMTLNSYSYKIRSIQFDSSSISTCQQPLHKTQSVERQPNCLNRQSCHHRASFLVINGN